MDGDVGRALRPFDREAEHLAPADLGEVALLGIAVADLGDVGSADRAPAADRDAGLTQGIGARGVAEHAPRLFGPGDRGPPDRGVEVHLSQFLVHLARGPAIALHPRRKSGRAWAREK